MNANRVEDDHAVQLEETDALLWQIFRALGFAGGVAWLVVFWNWMVS